MHLTDATTQLSQSINWGAIFSSLFFLMTLLLARIMKGWQRAGAIIACIGLLGMIIDFAAGSSPYVYIPSGIVAAVGLVIALIHIVLRKEEL